MEFCIKTLIFGVKIHEIAIIYRTVNTLISLFVCVDISPSSQNFFRHVDKEPQNTNSHKTSGRQLK